MVTSTLTSTKLSPCMSCSAGSVAEVSGQSEQLEYLKFKEGKIKLRVGGLERNELSKRHSG